MASGSIISQQIDAEKNGNSGRFHFLGIRNMADGDYNHEIKRCLLLLRKAMKNLVKVKSVKMLVAQSCLTLCDPMDCNPPGSFVHGILQARILEGFHALLQGIFCNQGSNPGLPPCRQILYCLSHQGNPRQHIKKQRHHFTNKAPYSQSYGFSSSYVWM